MDEKKLKWQFEGISWLISICISFIIFLPLYFQKIDHPYFWYNLLFVIVFFHYTRYLFFLKHTPFALNKLPKLIFIFTAIPLGMILLDGVNLFQKYNDEVGLQELVKHLHISEQTSWRKFLEVEMIFFGVGSMITNILLPFRMIVSIWRVRNRVNEI